MVILYYVFGPGNKADKFITGQTRDTFFLSIHPFTPQPSIYPPTHPQPTICPSIKPPTPQPSICPSLQSFSGPPVTGSQSLFTTAAILLHHHTLNSSASSSHFPLPSPTLLCTHRCLPPGHAKAICYLSCTLHVHTISAYYFSFIPKLFVFLPFFSLITSFLTFNSLRRPCTSSPEIHFCT